mgnify:FL=1
MSGHGLGTDVVTQIAIVVRDIERAVERYCAILGLDRPDIIITDAYDQARTTYRGEPTPARAKLAFFQLGQVALELIEPVGGPSTGQEALEQKGEGVHHIALVVPDTDAATRSLGAHGINIVQQGYYTGGRYTYLDSQADLGVVLELLENFASD